MAFISDKKWRAPKLSGTRPSAALHSWYRGEENEKGSAESQVPGMLTWLAHVDARLERLATTEIVGDRLRVAHREIAAIRGMLRVIMWGGGIVGAIVLAAALKTLFGW